MVRVTKPNALLFVSGVAAIDDKLEVQCAGDVGGQAQVIFDYIRRDLEAAGASMADIVKMTVYLRDKHDQWAVRNARSEFFEPGHFPASTMIEVSDFCIDGMLIEIDAIAITT